MTRMFALAVVAASLAVSAACSTDAGRTDAPAGTSTTEPASLGEPIARSSSPSSELYVVRSDGATTIESVAADSDRYAIAMTVSDPVLSFTDRPHRGAARISAAELVDGWNALGFASDPPNAALAGSSGGTDVDLAVELGEPRWNAATRTLTLSARTIGDDRGSTPPAQIDDASLFIDDAQSSASIRLSTGTTALAVAAVDVPFNPAGPDGQTPTLEVEFSSAGTSGPVQPEMELTGQGGYAAIVLTNPEPGTPFTASFTVGEGPLRWTISATFAADGQISGTVTQLGLSPSAQEEARSLFGSSEYGYSIPELEPSGGDQLLSDDDIIQPLSFDDDVASLRWN